MQKGLRGRAGQTVTLHVFLVFSFFVFFCITCLFRKRLCDTISSIIEATKHASRKTLSLPNHTELRRHLWPELKLRFSPEHLELQPCAQYTPVYPQSVIILGVFSSGTDFPEFRCFAAPRHCWARAARNARLRERLASVGVLEVALSPKLNVKQQPWRENLYDFQGDQYMRGCYL